MTRKSTVSCGIWMMCMLMFVQLVFMAVGFVTIIGQFHQMTDTYSNQIHNITVLASQYVPTFITDFQNVSTIVSDIGVCFEKILPKCFVHE